MWGMIDRGLCLRRRNRARHSEGGVVNGYSHSCMPHLHAPEDSHHPTSTLPLGRPLAARAVVPGRERESRDEAWGVEVGGEPGRSVAGGFMGMHMASGALRFSQIDRKRSSSRGSKDGGRIFDWSRPWATLHLATDGNAGSARGP